MKIITKLTVFFLILSNILNINIVFGNDTEISENSDFILTNSTASGETTDSTNQIKITNSNSGESNITENIKLEIPDIQIEIQSGLKLDGNKYICTKEECKINLNIEKIFNEDYEQSNYNCLWDFGGGVFTTSGTDKKCNPGYINYSSGSFAISIILSEKDNSSNYKEKILDFTNIVNIENIITPINLEQEITNSGTSNSGHTSEINQGASSGAKNTNTNTSLDLNNIEEDNFIFPKIEFEIQSGIEKTGTGSNKYICKKENCKVNLSIEKIFTGSFNQNNYSCEWEFGSGSYTSGTEKKCNPGYITYGTGIYEINFKLLEKNNTNNYITGGLIIYNTGTTLLNNTLSTSTGEINLILDNNYSDDNYQANSSSGDIISSTKIKIKHVLQQPSYLVKTNDNQYYCDRSKEKCKVNFNFEISLESEKQSNFECQISSTFFSGYLDTCNPNTVYPGLGDNIVFINIINTETNVLAGTGSIYIKNEGYNIIVKSSGSSSSKSSTKASKVKLKTLTPNITIQSGLNDYNSCKKEVCKINLIYKEKQGELCEWHFSGGEYSEKTKYKCNPGYITYNNLGDYNIKLKVSDKNYPNNYKITNLNFINKKQDTATQEEITKNQEEDNNENNTDNKKNLFNIELQGKVTDYKNFSGDTIKCNRDRCNINLDGSKSSLSSGNKLSLKWYILDEIYEGLNPKAVWFESGNYTIKIEGFSENKKIGEKLIQININTDTIENNNLNTVKLDNNKLKHLKIHKILGNPRGKDTDEYISLIYTGTGKINLNGIELDDILNGGSKKYKIQENIFLSYNRTIKLYKYTTKINLNNNGDTVNIIYDNVLIDSLSWDYILRDNFVVTHQNSKIESQNIKINRIVDGDTLEIILENGTKEKLRLVGVDAPEIYSPKDKLEKYFGQLAYDFNTKEILGKNLKLKLSENNYRDKYSRLLGYVILEDNTNYNELIIKNGYARAYLLYPFKYSQNFKKAETYAKKNYLIIWGNKQFKKTLTKINKIEKNQILENNKLIETEEEALFYKDDNKDNIPDQFQTIKAQPELIINNSDLMNTIKNKISYKETYSEHIEKSFYINIGKLKKGIKISGKTIPSAKVTFKIGKNQFITNSDSSGIFSYQLDVILDIGKYTILSEITDIFGNVFMVEKTINFTLEKEYIDSLTPLKKLEEIKKEKALLKKQKALNKKFLSTKNSKTNYSNFFITTVNAESKITHEYTTEKNQNKILFTLIIFVLSLNLLFGILKGKKLV